MSRITLTSFVWVPPLARGLVRDLRVRWAVEEAGLPYEQRLIGPSDQASREYLRQQPFGQVPVCQEDDLTLFESGAIVLHRRPCRRGLPGSAIGSRGGIISKNASQPVI